MAEKSRQGGKRIIPLVWVISLIAVSLTVLAQQEEKSVYQDFPEWQTGSAPSSQPSSTVNYPDYQPILGVAINAHHITHLDWYIKSVDQIAKLNANALILVTPMWMKNVNSSEIRFLSNRCPTDEQLTAILSRAKKHGLKTYLLPIILLEKASAKEWRGVIKPDDWNVWWKSYDAFTDRFVALANNNDVDVLSIGSELNTTESQANRWEHVISRIRKKFDGELMYSANWDRYKKVQFWNQVDIMAVSSYFELTDKDTEPTLNSLTNAWVHERDAMLAKAKEYNLPLILSEVGYPSLSSAAAFPWNYVNKNKHKADHNAQALCWRSFFEAWSDSIGNHSSNARGFFVYHWDPYKHGDTKDTGYGIENKPAYNIIKNGFARIRLIAEQYDN